MGELHQIHHINLNDFFSWITLLSLVSVIISLLMIYLSVNKIWVRKHEPEVSDSISLFAQTMAIVQASIGLTLALNGFNFKGIFLGALGFSVASLYIFIAIGFWVNNELTLKQKIFRAFKMDRAESSSIIKDLLHVSSIQKIFRIVCMLAWTDKELQDEEVVLLKEFAKHHNIDYEAVMKEVSSSVQEQDSVLIMTRLKKDLEKYLKTSPQKSVLIWFQDLVEKLVNADGVVTNEEAIMVDEIKGVINSYLGKKIEKYNLILLPQSPEDEFAALQIKGDLIKSENSIFGSKIAYIVDSFYSEKFANITREKYVKLFNCAVTIEKF